MVRRIPWQRGTTYNDIICRQYTNYVTRTYGYAFVVFDGYQEGLCTKDGAHERAAHVEEQAQQWIPNGIWS